MTIKIINDNKKMINKHLIEIKKNRITYITYIRHIKICYGVNVMTNIIEVDSIMKEYKEGQVVLAETSLKVQEGIFLAIVGPSGSGKSTLLNIMSGLLKPTRGRVFFNGDDITKYKDKKLSNFRRNNIGLIFQNYYLLSYLTNEENIKVGMSTKNNNYSINKISSILRIDDILSSFPTNISGGQQQRIAIARAIIKKPDILFCDEATGALDEANSKNVISLLHNVQKKLGITIAFVTHNHDIAKTADRIITLKDGKVYSDEINNDPIDIKETIWL